MDEAEGGSAADMQLQTGTLWSAQSAAPFLSELPKTQENKSKLTLRGHSGRGSCTSHLVILLTASLVLSLVIPSASGMPQGLLCDSKTRCLHNGVLRLPDTPFGYCRCICQRGYVGPRCQFNKRIRHVNRLKRLVKLRNSFEEYLKRRSKNSR